MSADRPIHVLHVDGGENGKPYAMRAGWLPGTDPLMADYTRPVNDAWFAERARREAAARQAPKPPAAAPVASLRHPNPGEVQLLAKHWGEQASWRTLADVPDDPPEPLLFDMLEDGPNLGYGGPGVGKGLTAAWVACQAQAAGMLPMIFDAERREREYARRVSGLGGDRARVIYMQPGELHVSLLGKPMWESAPYVGAVAKRAGVDLLIVDSILPAIGVGEERLKSDAQAPYLYVQALDALGIPSLSLGHPPKGQPEGDPFGSFAWVAAMRLTWLATKAEGDGHRIRWRPRKRNERGHIPGFLLHVEYGDDGRPCHVVRSDDEESTRDWLVAALGTSSRTLSDLEDEMLGELDEPPAGERDRIHERLGQALRRMARQGWVRKEGTSRSTRWSIPFEGKR